MAVSCMFLAGVAHAKVSIAPSRVEAKVPPGKGFEDKFVLVNVGDSPSMVSIHWRDRTTNPLKEDWFAVEKDSVTLDPGEETTVGYTVSVPEEATGEYNAWFIVSEGEPIGKAVGANLALRMSIPVYVTVKGTEKYGFEVKDIRVTNRNFAMLQTQLRNTGNVHIRPTGSVSIESIDTDTTYSIPFNDVQWGIISQQEHYYITKLPEDALFEDGTYKAVIYIRAGDEESFEEWNGEVVFEIEGTTGKVIRGFTESIEYEEN